MPDQHHITLSVHEVLDSSTAWEVRYLVQALLLPQTSHVTIDFRHCKEFEGQGIELLLDFLSEMESRSVGVELTGIALSRVGPLRDSLQGPGNRVRSEGGEFYSIFLMSTSDG